MQESWEQMFSFNGLYDITKNYQQRVLYLQLFICLILAFLCFLSIKKCVQGGFNFLIATEKHIIFILSNDRLNLFHDFASWKTN